MKFKNDSQRGNPTSDEELMSSRTMSTKNLCDISDKFFLNCNVELSSKSTDSFNFSSRKENDNWKYFYEEAFKSNYLAGNDYCLEGSWNGLKIDLQHAKNTPASMTNNANSSNQEASC